MNTDRQVLINIDSPQENPQLKFENFSSNNSQSSSNFHLPTIGNKAAERIISSYSLEYLQKFFDVNTDTVINRIIGSMYPKSGINFLQHHINSKPDLYGPFWICVTLIFTIAISGNIANYLQAATREEVYHWRYDFHAVSSAATTIFIYAWVVPIIAWTVLQKNGSSQLTLLELLCVYGYSLSVYVPISILWVIQVNWIQWMLVFVGASLSGYVLMTSISSAFSAKNFAYLLILLCLHVLLAIGFMLYFFHVPPMTNTLSKPQA